MIKPVIIAEYHQTKQHLLKVIAVFGLLTLILRFFAGTWGVFILLAFVLPNLGMSLGHGTFAEEFSKGQFKFLYGLPVGKFNIWLVKFISGLLGLFVFASIMCAVMFAFPGQDLRELLDFLPQLQVTPLSLAFLIASITIYSYGVGFFSITACATVKIAGMLSGLLLYLPLGAFWLTFKIAGWFVSLNGFSMILIIAACSFSLAALFLFLLRNPFLDSPWTRRLTGTGLVAAIGVVMVITTGVAVAFPGDTGIPGFNNVIWAHASPDGKHLFLGTQERFVQIHGYIVAVDGTVEHDLGAGVQTLGNKLTWQQSPAGLRVAYSNSGPTSSQLFNQSPKGEEAEVCILNLETGQVTRIPNLQQFSEDGTVTSYSCWGPQGKTLLGKKVTWEHGNSKTVMIAQDTATGEVTNLADPFADTTVSYVSGGFALLTRWNEDDTETSQRLFNTNTGKVQDLTLPEDHNSLVMHPDGESVIYVNKFYDGDLVGHEIVKQSISNDQRTILVESEFLPGGTLEQAARHKIGSVYFNLSPDERLITCSIYDPRPSATSKTLLVDVHSKRQIELPDLADEQQYAETFISPQGSKLLRIIHLDSLPEDVEDETEGEDLETTSVSTELQFFDLQLDADNPTKIHSLQLDSYAGNLQWLDDNTIIYLKAEKDQGLFSMGSSLWRLDSTSGIPKRVAAPVEEPVKAISM